MQKDFVPYEQSLILKRLGFKEPCVALYSAAEKDDNKFLWAAYTASSRINSDEHLIDNSYAPKTVTAPTFSQAFRFFREKYELHTVIANHEDELACLIKLIQIVDDRKKQMQYFLFGYDACEVYHDSSNIDKAINKIKKSGDFSVCAYDPITDSPTTLLSEFDGWSGYTEITEEQYNKFIS